MATTRKQINLRASEAFLTQLDEVRGGVPRETWIRAALTKVVRDEMRKDPRDRRIGMEVAVAAE